MTIPCEGPHLVSVGTHKDLATRLFGQLEWMEHMKNSMDGYSETTGQTRRLARGRIFIGSLVALAVALAVWAFVAPVSTTPTDSQASQTPGNIDAQTNDVDAVTQDAELPTDDAEPNPVVPQNAVVPPASVDDAPPD